jgi:hypothetical protein
MPDDYWNAHNQGRLGNARPVGGGPRAWQAYDQGRAERERQQQSSAGAHSAGSISGNSGYSSRAGSGKSSYHDGSGDVFPGFVLLIFMGLFTWGVVALNGYFKLTESFWLIPGALLASYLLGIIILRILMLAFMVIFGLAILAGLGYWGWTYASDRIKDRLSQKTTPAMSVKTMSVEEGRKEYPGCAICQDVMRNGAEITQERMSFFKLTPQNGGKAHLRVICKSIAETCSAHNVRW